MLGFHTYATSSQDVQTTLLTQADIERALRKMTTTPYSADHKSLL